MSKLRASIVLLTLSAALLIPLNDAFARGGRGGGGGGGGGGRGGGGGGGGGRGGGGGGMGGGNQVNAAAQADQQQITTINGQISTVNEQISAATKTISDTFYKDPKWKDAQKALDDATSELHKARDAVINVLKTQPDYKSATAKEKAAHDKLDTMKDNGAMRDEISKQADVILKAGGVVSGIEKVALDKDPPYQDCLKKVADAKAVVDALKADLDGQIKGDATIASLKTQQTDLKSQLTQAQQKLQQDLASGGAGGGGRGAGGGFGGG